MPFRGKDIVSALGIQGLDLSHVGNGGGFPLFYFSDGTGFSIVGYGRDNNGESRTAQVSDGLNWIRNRHKMQFGAEARRKEVLRPLSSSTSISDDFGSFVFTSGAFSGSAFVDFLLWVPAQSAYAVLGPNMKEFSTHYAFYAQDNWIVSGRLTLNFGLRWELHPPLHEAADDITNFDRSTGDVIVPDHTLPPRSRFPRFDSRLFRVLRAGLHESAVRFAGRAARHVAKHL